MKAKAYTMQALVKYHGLKDWNLRIPYHDSISVNTTCMYTEAEILDKEKGGIIIDGKRDDDANRRLENVLSIMKPSLKADKLWIASSNHPKLKVKGVGFSSSAGAAITLLCYRYFNGKNPEPKELSKFSRLFAASAARSSVGGFSRLYAGSGHEDTFAVRFADKKDMDLKIVIVPLYSDARTEQAHKDVESSPFFKARVVSAQKRCDMVEKAILSNDIDKLGELVEQDTLELHSITMTGSSRTILMTEDSLRVIRKVREMRSEGIRAYFSMQTGPSVFINTNEENLEKVVHYISKLGYRVLVSDVGPEASIIEQS